MITELMQELAKYDTSHQVHEDVMLGTLKPGVIEPYRYTDLTTRLTDMVKKGTPVAVVVETPRTSNTGLPNVIGIFGEHETGHDNAKLFIAAGRITRKGVAVLTMLRIKLGGLAANADDVLEELGEMGNLSPELAEVRDTLEAIAKTLKEVL